MKTTIKLYALTAVLLLTPGLAVANPLDQFGLGARNQSMAGAVTALVSDSTSTYYNPAGLALAKGITLDIGYFYNTLNLKLNGRDLGVDGNSGLQAGIVIPGKIGPVGWAFGLSVFLPDSRVSRVRALPQFQPRFVLYDNRTQRLVLTACLAIRPLKWLSIGGGVTFLSNTGGGLNIAGRLTFPDPDKSQLLSQVNVSLGTVRYPHVGVTFIASDKLSIGVAYRGESKLKMNLKALVKGVITDGETFTTKLPAEFTLHSFNTNLYSPHQLVVGMAYRPLSQLLWTVDLAWLHWSGYPASTADVEVTLAIVGIGDNLLPPKVKVVAPNFHDTVTVRTGLEYKQPAGHHLDVFFRAGYAYEPSPAPAQSGETNYADSNRHQVTAGIGLDIKKFSSIMTKPMSVDFAFQYFYLTRRSHEKKDPSDIIGDFVSNGHIFSLAISLRLQF